MKMANIHRFGCLLLNGITSYEASHIHITCTKTSGLCLLLKFLIKKKRPHVSVQNTYFQHINIRHKNDKF